MAERAKILLVDDRPENLLALEAILVALEQDLVRAESGEAALRALLKDDYALILLDVQMPGMDGFETAARIKRRGHTKDVPIIFLTAVDEGRHNAYRGFAAGGADYISKPFDPWILRAKVQVFVDLWEMSRQVATQGAFLRGTLGEHENVDVLGELRRRCTGVTESVEELTSQARSSGETWVLDSVDRVTRRLGALTQALDALDGGPKTG